MSEEADIAAAAAPEGGETASSPEAPVSGEPSPESKEAKTFTQEEVDALIGKRLAREERKWQRERDRQLAEAVRAQPQPKAEPAPDAKPTPEQFKTTEEYIEAVAEWKADQKITETLTKREQAAINARAEAEARKALSAYQAKEEAVREKYDDYEDVVYNPNLPITDPMAKTIQESDSGPELAYWLGKNPAEAARIARLSPFLQAKELGKIEAKMASAPPAKQTSSAPDPITPVKGKGGGTPVFDTTDPRSTKSMSTSEWIAAERRRQEEKWKAQGLR